MGLLDGALGSLVNAAAGGAGQGQMVQVIEVLLQQHGGLGGLTSQLTRGGLASEVQSWIGTGQNAPVSGNQITAALGNPQIAQLAQQLGIDPNVASGLIAQVLPHLVDHLTPNGQLPAQGAVASSDLASAIGALASRFLR